jgi:hypothetical protein
VKKPVKNVGTPVRARLLKPAKERGEDFQLVLLRYVNERLLYRLASSRHASGFVLKGAALFTVWTGTPHRATRDLDFLGYGDSTEAHLRQVFTDVASSLQRCCRSLRLGCALTPGRPSSLRSSRRWSISE